MEIGIVGLGKMGANMCIRLLQGGHSVVAFARTVSKVHAVADQGARGLESLAQMAPTLSAPRAAWVMVPAGDPTESVITELAASFDEGDIIIDGGNSNYKDTMRRAEALQLRGIHLVDVGTSGGVWGLTGGYSMMVGGEKDAVERLTPILETLAPGADEGWGRVGSSGSGHFVKMVHNGIEYGLMQAYAEGFEIMSKKEQFDLDLHQVAEIWRFGSVVRSWLLDLTAAALEEDATLSELEGWVADSGEGRWTVAEAIDLDVPAPVITMSLLMRLVSRQDESFAAKLLAAMRNQFGGHAVKRAKE